MTAVALLASSDADPASSVKALMVFAKTFDLALQCVRIQRSNVASSCLFLKTFRSTFSKVVFGPVSASAKLPRCGADVAELHTANARLLQRY